MNEMIIVRPEKCVGCSACIRVCPANEANRVIRLDGDRFITSVNADRCIGCGECIRACAHGARDYVDDTEEAMSLLNSTKLLVVASSALKTSFPTKWKSILEWFRNKGCLIYDEAFGADICTWAHLRAFEHGQVDNLITQPCAAIVRYIEIYQPKLLQNLSPIQSPAACCVLYLKNYLRRSEPVLYLSPCIAKKAEFSEIKLVDFNVTFKKLMDYFEQNDIRLSEHPADSFDFKYDDQQGIYGAIYPRRGGMRDNLWLHDPEMDITNSEGVSKVYRELEIYAKMPEQKKPSVFDVASCEFGCNSGVGTGSDQTMFDMNMIMRNVENDAKARRKIGGGVLRNNTGDRQFKRFDEELRFADFIRSYKPTPSAQPVGDAQLDPIYERMGKHTQEDRCRDCHACGFTSCREMATAIYRELNVPENCILYAKNAGGNAGDPSARNDRLAEVASECRALSERLSKNISEIQKNMNAINESADATSERASVVNDLLKNVVAFCNSKTQMDADSLKQLVSILETTIEAFGALDGNVATAHESSAVIKNTIDEIEQLVNEINGTLASADAPQNKEVEPEPVN